VPVSYDELVRKLKNLGFDNPEQGRRGHPIMKRGDFTLHIPNPHGRPIGIGLIKKILEQGNISREDWLSA
jgi:predicted RNA binding protein YcfA (HicA-like mRNA interferase family)